MPKSAPIAKLVHPNVNTPDSDAVKRKKEKALAEHVARYFRCAQVRDRFFIFIPP
jgi:hypothetical protein